MFIISTKKNPIILYKLINIKLPIIKMTVYQGPTEYTRQGSVAELHTMNLKQKHDSDILHLK